MADSWVRLFFLVCVFAAVLIAVETLVRTVAASRFNEKAINRRLTMIERGVPRAEALNRLRRRTTSLPARLPGALVGPAEKLERLLVQAGVTTPTSALLIIVAMTPVTLFVVYILLAAALASLSAGRLFLLFVLALVTGLVIPLMVLQSMANRKRRRIIEQFPTALDVFVRGLRAGYPISAALELLTTEMPDPIGSQFGIVVDEVTYGAELREALEAMADRWEIDDMRMFVVCLSVQRETGGNLAEILENLSKVIRDRASMMMKVRALSSEGRMSAIMLTILPIASLLILFLVNPPFYLEVADDPWFIPGFGLLIGLYLLGLLIIRRMIDLKV